MRRKSILLVLGLLASLELGAAPARYVFWNLKQHPEILGGFFPSWIGMGVGIDTPTFIPGRRTELQVLGGGGYSQRKAWYDPTTGLMLEGDRNPLVFDVEEYDWRLRFSQGFGASRVEGKDLLTAYAGYDGAYTKTRDSMVEGARRKNGGTKQDVLGVDAWFSLHGADSAANPYYPDMGQSLLTTLFAGVKFDQMDDRITTQDGFSAEFTAKYLPKALNDAMDGTADAYSFTVNLVASRTLASLKNADDRNLFSLVLIDRANANWTSGDAVPLYLQESTALARKVRGFSYWSYDTELSLVNNLELRICGPELLVRGVLPRVNFFYDVGYGCGDYYNTSTYGDHFLSSIGVQATVTMFDFFDLGLQYAYLFSGTDYTHYGDSLTTRVTFFLDF